MNKNVLKVTIGLSLFSALLAVDSKPAEAQSQVAIAQTYALNPLDISTGWTIDFKTNLANVNGEKIFIQDYTNVTTNQKMIINNFGNIGNAEMTATKIIPMKKGHVYNLDLIYAMNFSKGSGSIDFNGQDKVDSETVHNDALDHSFKKEVKPEKDMDYVITINYKVPMRATGFLKLGFDTTKGSGIEEKSSVALPELNAPFANQDKITGTGISGNTINIYDNDGNLLGTGVVDATGKFEVTVNRPFESDETIKGIQVDPKGVESSEASTTVLPAQAKPMVPKPDGITEESTNITGKGDPGSHITAEIGDEVYEADVDENGDFTIPLDHTFPFGTDVTLNAEKDGLKSDDYNGNVGYANDLAIAFDYTLSSIDTIIQGTTTRANTEISVKVGARVYTTTTDPDGNFDLTLATPYKAGTEVTATIKDKTGTTKVAQQTILPRQATVYNLSPNMTGFGGVVDPEAKVQVHLTHAGVAYDFETRSDASGNYTVDFVDENGAKIGLTMGDKLTSIVTLENINLSSEVFETMVYGR